jgi:hypothetical protein
MPSSRERVRVALPGGSTVLAGGRDLARANAGGLLRRDETPHRCRSRPMIRRAIGSHPREARPVPETARRAMRLWPEPAARDPDARQRARNSRDRVRWLAAAWESQRCRRPNHPARVARSSRTSWGQGRWPWSKCTGNFGRYLGLLSDIPVSRRSAICRCRARTVAAVFRARAACWKSACRKA